MRVRWKTVAMFGAIWSVSAVVGAGGVYLAMRPTAGAAQGVPPAPASAVSASGASDAPGASAPAGTSTPTASASGVIPASSTTGMARETTGNGDTGASDAPGSALPRESDPVPASPGAGHDPATATTADGSTAGARDDGKVDVPRMAQALGPFPDPLRSMACVPRHAPRSSDYDRPTWVCSVTLEGNPMPYPVRSNGPDGVLAIYSESLFASGYAFVYVAPHDGKDAHFSAAVDPKAAPYPATQSWTASLMGQAVEQAMKLDAKAMAGRRPAPSIGQRNADSWAAVGVR